MISELVPAVAADGGEPDVLPRPGFDHRALGRFEQRTEQTVEGFGVTGRSFETSLRATWPDHGLDGYTMTDQVRLELFDETGGGCSGAFDAVAEGRGAASGGFRRCFS
jgi:hypothetical protein